METINGININGATESMMRFMGVKPTNGFYDGHEMSRVGLPFAYGAMGNGLKNPPFHTSWDWLMVLVERIEGLNVVDEFNICYCDVFGIEVEINPVLKNTFPTIRHRNNTKIVCTWLAAFEFIEWYENYLNQ